MGGSHEQACLYETPLLSLLLDQSKVNKVDLLPIAQEDICRFNVTMKHALIMSELQDTGQLFENLASFFYSQWALCESLPQCPIFNIWNDHVAPRAMLPIL